MTHHKLLIDLTIEDLISVPCWKHYSTNKEEYALPIDKQEISETDIDNYVVLTEFILNDKTKYLGFSSPQDTSGIDYIQPVIVTSKGHFRLYFDNLEKAQLKNLTNEMLTKSIDEVFPLTFITQVKCDGKYFRGKVECFNSLVE